MKQSLSDPQILELLHHWRSERYLLNSANAVERFLLSSCFSSIEIEGINTVKERSDRGETLIFIPNHQSEYDWLILQTYLAKWNVPTAIQAGDNLFIGPLDTFLRKCGAFMSVREKREFCARHWLLDSALKLVGTRPFVVTKDKYNGLYLDQIKTVLNRDKLHLMIFPGYETDEYSGEVKYGRSYSGTLNPLSAYVLMVIRSALKALSISYARYIPVNITYERVPEDIVFREFQANTRKSKIAKYIYDHYYTFIKAPISRRLRDQKSRVCIKFGEGIPALTKMKAKDLSKSIRDQLGRLVRVYESMLVFSSLENRFKMSRTDLEERVSTNLDIINEKGLDTSPLYSETGRQSLEEMLMRTVKIFNFPKIPIIPSKSYMTLEYDPYEIFVHHPHLAAYYSNKLAHVLVGAAASKSS